MPYDPRNPDAFREILDRLAVEQLLSSEAIINLVLADKAAQKAPYEFNLSRYALDRFRKGKRIKNAAQLREVYRVLESHIDYREFFPTFSKPNEQPIPPLTAFSSAFARFLADGGEHLVNDLVVLGSKLVGRYVMYRPNWWPPGRPGFARASLIEIGGTYPHLTIAETQDFPADDEEEAGYQQHDTGAIGSFAKFIYFIMREDTPGTAVKFGLITQVFPKVRDSAVTRFNGLIFVSSGLAVYPVSKFSCKRLSDSRPRALRTVKSEIINIAQIPDEHIKQYLQTPLKLPQGF